MLPSTTAAGLLARRAASSPSKLCYNRSFTALTSRSIIESRPLNLSPLCPASTRNFSICRSSDLSSYSNPSLLPALRQFYASSLRHTPFNCHPPDRRALFATPSKEHPKSNNVGEKDGTTAQQGTDEVPTAERHPERKAEEGQKKESSSGEEEKEKSKEDEVRTPSVDSRRWLTS